jgi:5-methylcytosine-specific restriction endonuclease McrA
MNAHVSLNAQPPLNAPQTSSLSPEACPALVLNADYRPLSYYPLSLWCWQDAIKAVFLDRVMILSHYERAVSSPSFSMRLPSVVCLKSYVRPARVPAFTRFNVFLRDRFTCQYCGAREELTFDHVIPRSKGGTTTWENVVAACARCNRRKGNRLSPRVQQFSVERIEDDDAPIVAKQQDGAASDG